MRMVARVLLPLLTLIAAIGVLPARAQSVPLIPSAPSHGVSLSAEGLDAAAGATPAPSPGPGASACNPANECNSQGLPITAYPNCPTIAGNQYCFNGAGYCEVTQTNWGGTDCSASVTAAYIQSQ